MKPQKLTRPADAFLPSAFLAATLLGRDALAFDLFFCFLIVRLCALATADGLRAAFARQPSMRYVQGSACVALTAQFVGAGIAWGLGRALSIDPALRPLIACGLLLNIEHIFYEYMYAVGDGGSAAAVHGIAAILALTGLLLGCPPNRGAGNPSVYSPLPLLVACGAAALVGLFISLSLGGGFRPRLNPEVLKRAPRAMLETALWPGLFALVAFLGHKSLDIRTGLPLFAGLIIVSLCRVPFRRTPSESGPMNRSLLLVGGIALLALIPFLAGLSLEGESRVLRDIPYTLAAIPLASLSAFLLYGSLNTRKSNE